ncbi:TetR/AcrR family transcriptional regulator [Williamsia sp. 1135]|uniref:TetR/AcrR family transcriptional regulator n=1 Tax=Williamsia sp. 1135 TaxID=1889262 RepID=UPI00117F8627|nr:TetR/AcrR family transcriptional regulator [Williamsia sp. 1135]
MSGLRIEQVAAAAGVSTQTFHNAYPRGSRAAGGKAQFVEELLHSIVPGGSPPPDSAITDLFEQTFASADGDPREWIRDLAGQADAHLRRETSTPLRLRITAFAAPDGPPARAVHDQYDVITAAVVAAQSAAFTRLGGLSLRQPFTMEAVAVALTALAEGLVLRAQYDPASVPDSLLGDSAVALLSAVVDFDERHDHIDDAVVSLMEPPPDDDDGDDVGVDVWPDDPEQAVIDAAAIEFAQRGYFATRQAHIAHRAGIDLPTLRRLFPTNVDVIVAGLSPILDAVSKRIDADRRIGRTPTVIVERFGLRLSELLIEHRRLVEPMALVLSLHGAQSQVNATRIRDELFFPGLIVGVIEDGQTRGVFTADVPPIDMAVMFTNNIMFRCLSKRDETAEQVAAAVNRIFLLGIVVHQSVM